MRARIEESDMKRSFSMHSRLIDALTMLAVAGLSLMLLLYVGHGESLRTYEQFHIDKLLGQTRLIQDTLESFVRPGFPIRQFAGFSHLAEPVMAADATVAGIATLDAAGQAVFQAGEPGASDIRGAERVTSGDGYDIYRVGDRIKVVMSLTNRFERIGSVVVAMNLREIDASVDAVFQPLLLLAACAALAFVALTFGLGDRLDVKGSHWMSATFGIMFVIVASFVVAALLSLYAEGAQAKARSGAAALAARLHDAVAFQINLGELEGLDNILADYQRLNPDVSAVAIVANGRAIAHSNRKLAGTSWTSQPSSYQLEIPLAPEADVHAPKLVAEIPKSVIYSQVGRSAKNFVALFVASALLAALFMELARALRQAGKGAFEPKGAAGPTRLQVSLVKPAYFMAVFVENVSYAFLPQFMREVVANFGLSPSYVSAPFMAYYLCFALALLPAGRLELRIGSRPLIVGGLILSGASFILIAIAPYFPVVMLARAVAGLGQGTLFIGVQSYALANSDSGQRTQAAGIIVFGFQAGMLSGMSIGSLLITNIGVEGVFILAALVAAIASAYTYFVIPNFRMEQQPDILNRSRGAIRDFVDMLRDSQFLRTMCLIGVPAKAIMTGVVLFALPLLLSKQGFRQEDVGQIIMLYAASVVIVSNIAARQVDRSGRVSAMLFWGAMLSSLGLMLAAASSLSPAFDWNHAPTLATASLLIGIVVLGLAHGFINAPVITHVADAPIASRLGASSVAATYRFVERVGHVAGPLAMSQMFLLVGQSWNALCWVACGVGLCGVLFIATSGRRNAVGYGAEVPK